MTTDRSGQATRADANQPVRTTRIYERISANIQQQIAQGRFAPGTRLPSEREMARRHGVSRVTVREAYRSLEKLGILIVRRGAGGAVIADRTQIASAVSLSGMLRLGGTSAQELSDAWMIEPVIARLAARHASHEDVARLAQVLEAEEAALARHGQAGRHRLRFQRALAACARSFPLIAIMEALADLTLPALAASGSWATSEPGLCRLHRSVLEAVQRHDEAGAAELIRHHVAALQSSLADVRPGSDRGQTGVRPGSDRGQTRVRPGSDPTATYAA